MKHLILLLTISILIGECNLPRDNPLDANTNSPIAPTITTPPQSQTLTAGQNVTLTVAATGTPPLSYQWYKDGMAISGATSSSYSIPIVQTFNAGTYTVTVSNGTLPNATSNGAVLTVNSAPGAPSITTPPQSQTVTAGQSVTFSVTATGTAPLLYQWYKGGYIISGATSSSYLISNVQAVNAGTYTVTVSNGSLPDATSSGAVLTVTSAPVAPSITIPPQSQTITAGQSATFSVTATGTAPLSYQWYKGGTAISGATSSSYTISNAQVANAGTYSVTVSNGTLPNTTSSGAVLTVSSSAPVAPSITIPPQSQTVTAGQSVTFSVTASGTAPLSYQWYKGGTAISGATSSSYTISNVQAANVGTYTITVSNGTLPNATSSGAVLTVSATSVPNIVYSAYSLYDGGLYNTVGNGDNIANKNETLRMNVELQNSGTSDVTGVTATISTTSSYITLLSPTTASFNNTSYPKIQAGYYRDIIESSASSSPYVSAAQSSSCFLFSVSGSCPAGTVVTFNLAISDDKGNSWTQSFTVTVSGTGANIVYTAYSLYDGGLYNTVGNGDGIANKNETLRMNVELKNSGTSDATGVSATISTTSSYITLLSPTTASFNNTSYPKIQAGYYRDIIESSASSSPYVSAAQSSSCFLFSVSGSCPAGTVVTFNLAISDDKGNSWTQSFTVTVSGTGANIVYTAFSLYDGGLYNTVGNGDGIANKNETLRMNVELKNSGTSDATGVTATISTTSSYITLLSPTTASFNNTSYPKIQAGYYRDIIESSASSSPYVSAAQSSSCFLFSVSGSCPAGTVVTFNLAISDDKGNSWTQSFTITVSGTGANIVYSAYSLYDGGLYNTVGNGDNIANKNETLRMNVELQNSGTSDATGVTATISTTSSYITLLSPTTASFNNTSYPKISAGYYRDIIESSASSSPYVSAAQSSSCFLFSVSGSCPAGTIVTFNLAISDDKGNSWTQSFTVTVSGTGANIVYSAYSLYDGGLYNTVGNGDNIANKNETLRMNVELQNSGTSDATGVTATISTTSSYITLLSPTTASFNNTSYPKISAGYYRDIIESSASSSPYVSAAQSSSCFLFSVSGSCPAGTIVTFNLAISDDKGNSWTQSFTVTVQ